jgi:CRISPR/Cas system CMR subunit Cmr4 (Cas7 group RAMP superfamily)
MFLLVLAVAFVTAVYLNRNNDGAFAKFVPRCVGVPVFKALLYVVQLLDRLCREARSFAEEYLQAVEEYQENTVIPTIQAWQMDETEELDADLQELMVCVRKVYSKSGYRPRCASSFEAVQRQLRRNVVEHTVGEETWFTEEQVPTMVELGTQLYFNPPYTMRASFDVLSGFQ